MPIQRRQFLQGATALLGSSALTPAYAQINGGFADLAVLDARVTTMDPALPEATALATRDGRFIKVGDEADVAPLIGPFTQVIRANKKRIIPGLIDSHTHSIRGGVNYNLEVRWDAAGSLEEALHLLRLQADRTP